jgi:hypothetical protein
VVAVMAAAVKMKARLMRRSVMGAVVAVVLAVVGAGICRAEVKIHALVIGNNRAFTGRGADSSDEAAPALKFADDDAAAFFELMEGTAEDAHLLTVMDRETQSIYPQLGALARPPTMRELRAAVVEIGRSIERNRRDGDSSVLFIFFSGHGSMIEGETPALALLDGGISQKILYDEILAQLPADYVHVLVDACHAEAVVRPRDTEAQTVRVTPAESNAFLVGSTLARFPHVGAIVAAATDARSHEWDLLRHGVFTHELLSALRGAADVNRDGRIEYSEVYAFLGAANDGVRDPRARLSVVARPPDVNRRVTLLDLTRFAKGKVARLTGVPGRAGLVRVEEGSGRLIASTHGEVGLATDLIVPAGQTVYVNVGGEEARFESKPGQDVPFGGLAFAAAQERPRGALEDAMRRGLFLNEFGRHYYSGFIDYASEFDSVSFAPEVKPEAADASVSATAGGAAAAPADGSAMRLVLGAGASRPVARSFDVTDGLRLGLRPTGASGGLVSLDLFRAAGVGTAEWQMVASAGRLWSARLGDLRGWLGVTAGGGAIRQTAAGQADRWSGLLEAGPTAGLTVELTHEVALWGEAQLSGLAYRRDDRTVIALSPAGWLGLSLGL